MDPATTSSATAFDVLRGTLVPFSERKQEFFCLVCRYRDPLGPDGTQLHDENCPLLAAITEHEQLRAERDDAREWVKRMHREGQTLTCVYCGHAYPPGTPASGSAVLTEHIKVCAKHPLRTAEAQLSFLRGAIAETVGYTLTGDVDADDAQLVDRLHAPPLFAAAVDPHATDPGTLAPREEKS